MAKAELTDARVQGQGDPKDALDRLIAIAAEIAQRNDLLDEPVPALDVPSKSMESISVESDGHDDRRRPDQNELVGTQQ